MASLVWMKKKLKGSTVVNTTHFVDSDTNPPIAPLLDPAWSVDERTR
jgi:hypothetical protein